MFRPPSIVCVIIACLTLLLEYKTCTTERITYISTEHPAITYLNKKYVPFMNISSRRFGRQNRFYYVDLHIHTLFQIDNNFKFEFFFYEYLSNTYRRSFVEMTFKSCDLILKDKFFGPALRKAFGICPVPAGIYQILNCTIPIENIPKGFPFNKGRIYLNVTYIPDKELVGSGHIDMELKEYSVKKKTG